MNKLSLDSRAAIVRALVDGASIRSIARMMRCDKDTVTRILVEVGEFCSIYQDCVLTNLPCTRIEADEIWAFVGAKQANAKNDSQGDIWTYTGICADTKLAVSWLVGMRGGNSAQLFMADLASRLKNRIQLTTDKFSPYIKAVEEAFGFHGVDYGMIKKTFGMDGGGDHSKGRYSPSSVVIEVEKVAVFGHPKKRLVSTSYVERHNLEMRMKMRRFTRLTKFDYSAIDDDTYDGAPDAGRHPIGRGPTRDAALRDLAEQWDEAYTEAELNALDMAALKEQDVTTLVFLNYLRAGVTT